MIKICEHVVVTRISMYKNCMFYMVGALNIYFHPRIHVDIDSLFSTAEEHETR